MTVAEQIRTALQIGPLAAPEIAKVIDAKYRTVFMTLQRMIQAGEVTMTRAASRDRSAGAMNLYSMAAGGAVDLGMVTPMREAQLARLVGDIAFEQGEVALFIGKNGCAALAVYNEPGYQRVLDAHGADLVGRYRIEEGKNFQPKRVMEDVRERMLELDRKRKVA